MPQLHFVWYCSHLLTCCRKKVMQLKKYLISWVKLVGRKGGVLSHMYHAVRSVSTENEKLWESSTQALTSSTNLCIHVLWKHIFYVVSLQYSFVFICRKMTIVLKFLSQASLRELTTLGIKNAVNLAIPRVRNVVSLSWNAYSQTHPLII